VNFWNYYYGGDYYGHYSNIGHKRVAKFYLLGSKAWKLAEDFALELSARLTAVRLSSNRKQRAGPRPQSIHRAYSLALTWVKELHTSGTGMNFGLHYCRP
jgi:hypothetical protein